MPDTGFAVTAEVSPERGAAAPVLRHVVTGNRLRDGAPVYFAGEGRWSTAIDDAKAAAPEAAEGLLAQAQAGPAPHPVVAPYLIEAAVESSQIRPLSLREQIRAFGPTVAYRA
jgi:hypothetical protein